MASDKTLIFDQVDVFGSAPFMGNPLAVIHGADALSTADMERIARWTNLSETTFLLTPTQPDADYRVRIFTPEGELPFAGHPTLGTAWAWLHRGGKPLQEKEIIQECELGKIRVKKTANGLAFAAPPLLRDGPVDEPTLETICRGLSIQRNEILAHQWVDNGPGWAALVLDSTDRVLSIEPDFSMLKEVNFGIIGSGSPNENADYEVRVFVESLSIPEDPVTGSLAAGIAIWFAKEKMSPAQYTLHQGTRLQRSGLIEISQEEDAIWIGGTVLEGVQGTLRT